MRLSDIVRRVFGRLSDTDLKRRYFGGIAWNSLGLVFGRGLGLVGAVIAARVLGKEGFGAFGVIQGTVVTFAFVASVSAAVTATKFIAQHRKNDVALAGRFLALCWATSCLFALLVTGVTWFGAGLICDLYLKAPELKEPLKLAALAVTLSALTGTQNGILTGLERFKVISILTVVTGISNLTFIGILAYNYGVAGAVLGIVISEALLLALNTYFLSRELRSEGIVADFAGMWNESSVLMKFWFPHLLGSLLNMPLHWVISGLLVRQADGIGEMALYTAAYRWRQLILFVPATLGNVSTPILAEKVNLRDTQAVKKVLWASLFLVGGVSIGLGILISLFGPWIMAQYGDEFRAGGPIVLFLVLTEAALRSVSVPLTNLTTAAGLMWMNLACNVISGIVLLGAAFFLVKQGAVGLAAAHGLSAFVCLVLLFCFVMGFLRKKLFGAMDE